MAIDEVDAHDAAMPVAVPPLHRHFAAAVEQVPLVRRAAHEWLHKVLAASGLPRTEQTDDVVFDVELVVTELVTNGVNAGASAVELTATLDDGIRIEVFDDGSGLPVPQDAPLTSDHGRGLRIVGDVAAEWGTRVEDDGRTLVWARIATD